MKNCKQIDVYVDRSCCSTADFKKTRKEIQIHEAKLIFTFSETWVMLFSFLFFFLKGNEELFSH